MYIEKLTVKGFRCFDREKMDFNWPATTPASQEGLRLPNVNLLIGNNGTGKTTVFQALTIVALRSYLAKNTSGFRTPMAIRHTATFAEAVGSLLLAPLDIVEDTEHMFPNDNVSVSTHSVTSKLRRIGTEQSLDSGRSLAPWMNNLFDANHPGCFIAAYGAGRRTELLENYSLRNLGTRYRRVASLFEPHIGMMPLSMACTQCKKKERWGEVVEIVNRLVQLPVRLTIQADEGGEPLFDYDGIMLPASELSDGYRLFIGWLIDCLAHLSAVLPPQWRLTEAVGIVIVDEVDLFLAPSWQRTVLESLSATFSSIQWFCSTHSPLVAGSLDNENIYILKGSGPFTSRIRRPTDEFEGKSVDEVLVELFDVQQPRSPQLQRQMSELAEQAMNGDLKASLLYLRRLNEGSGQLR